MSEIRILFVIPEHCQDSTECSEIMLQAYEACESNVANVSWITCAALCSEDLTKTDFIVFDEFAGSTFETIQAKANKSARIVGPWCVSICLLEGKSIPNFPWPIYNVAMVNCVVSCSHLPKPKKLEIKERVQLMGGAYTENFLKTNTHLVTDSVRSEKYLQAAEKGAKIMIADWIDAVWEQSKNSNVHADDEQFKKFICLPFHNLTVCSTGLPNAAMRQEVAKKVVKNGGIFTGSLTLSSTDILLVYGTEGQTSTKYKAAKHNPNISCVSIEWVDDSIAKGYALPKDQYEIKLKTSTPNKSKVVCPDFSMLSAIGDTTTCNKSVIEESHINKNSTPVDKKLISPPSKRKSSNDYGKLVDGLDIKKAKMAGQYLDGCSVFVVGFNLDQHEKLCKILNLSGATRYDDLCDRISHIIVGDTACPELKIIKSRNYQACLVSINWLLDSIEAQKPVDEEKYLIPLHDIGNEQFSSPLTRKGLNLLRSHKTMTSEECEVDEDDTYKGADAENEIIQQYLVPPHNDHSSDTLAQLLNNADSDFLSKPNIPEPTQKSEVEEFSSQEGFSQQSFNFQRKKFKLEKFPTEEAEVIKSQIETALGTVLPKNYNGIPDYIVAPMFIHDTIGSSALEIVNELWIAHCLNEDQYVEIKYYHRPLVISDLMPLENCVVTISGYSSFERMFLKGLVESLGGILQEQFSRITSEKKGTLESTHLVSLEASGKKYDAALKWGIPVVTKEWLFECAKLGLFVSEEKFLMGASKVSKSHVNRVGSLGSNVVSKTPIQKESSRVLTPLNRKEPLNIGITSAEKTPVNQRLFKNCVADNDSSPCSQVTPINKIMEEFRKSNLLATPKTPYFPKTAYSVETPEETFGAGIQPNMSANSRKELLRYLNKFPDFKAPVVYKQRRDSTPLSEVKRRCWAKILGEESQRSPTSDRIATLELASTSSSSMSAPQGHSEKENSFQKDLSESQKDGNVETASEVKDNTQNLFIQNKLKELESMMDCNGSNRRISCGFSTTVPTQAGNSEGKESQPFTVTWDYKDNNPSSNQNTTIRLFIISGVNNELRQSLVEKIERLGAQVSNLSNYDPVCTHMICPKPARNEKTLACMASGKWILHLSYIDKSLEAGRFLDEEEFEFGNPKSRDNIKLKFDQESAMRCESMFWWRKEIARKGYKPFNDMRAIVVASKRDPMVRVIEAGGGTVVDAEPPFTEPVHATHCLLEPRSVKDFSLYNPLARQGIYCVNTMYINDFLHRVNKDIRDLILPQFSQFY